MMPALKRSYDVANNDGDGVAPLQRVRNMWQFANLVQWIYIFGKAAKIDESIDVEVIENETLRASSTILQEVALALVKLASSFRGIASDGLDDQLRKLYRANASESNPFGEDEDPIPFDTLDPLIKIRVLQQLTQWVMIHPERFRDKMEEQRDVDQTAWRIEPYGWDSEDRTYYVLDDNRLYRLTEPPPPPPPTKKPKRMKTYRGGRRSSRRHRVGAVSPDEEASDSRQDEAGDETFTQEHERRGDDTLGGMIWECIAVTLAEVETFLESISRSRDENEKILRNQIKDHLLPILQKQEESRRRREQQRERELLNLAKMANAKRSSRIAGKIEQQKQDNEAKREQERLRQAQTVERREEAERLKRERERDLRMASREERLKERELRRRRHEEELAQLSEDSRNLSEKSGRISERKLQADIERNQQALKELEEEEEDWIFDCTCGLYGKIDDGKHSIACEKCNVWQHSKCTGISEPEAERQDFHFVCPRCLRREQEAFARDRPAIKLKLHSSGSRPPSSAGEARTSIVVELPVKVSGRETIANELPTSTQNQVAHDTTGAQNNGSMNGVSSSTSYTSQAVGTLGDLPQDQGQRQIKATASEIVTGPQGVQQAKHDEGDMNLSPSFNIKTPSQRYQNGESTNGAGQAHLLATPSLAAAGTHAAERTNGLHSSPAGISPIKSSPQVPVAAVSSSDANRSTKLVLSPMTSLVPAPTPHDPTPPIKPLDVRSSFSSETNTKDLKE
ncbi:hypothetical protein NLU13_9021 [Sarocladium strictum]|uniref:Zinc finger PHD-type domain-containing protein n=1 Tax=Sarocladium strictum TaxID=5046 RepID=A0AA39G9D4_SARSR|nr:hypothetical protein NLU13_9021 [Sarocladium strictum]